MAAGLQWSASEDGALDLEVYMDRAADWAQDMRDPLGGVKDHIQFVMRMQFLTEGGYRSGGWVELSEDYALWKDLHAPGMPMLQLTTEMHNIVLSDASWDVGRTEAIFDPPSEKAGWHQEGVPFRHGGGRQHNTPNPLPPRPILDLDEEDYAKFEDIFEDWLSNIILPAFPGAPVARGPRGRFIRFP